MNQIRQRNEPNHNGSRTITVQNTNSENDEIPSTLNAPPVGVLQLRGTGNTSRRVVWSEETIDNEGMGKKKSKICCIYHKPKQFDESSDESSGPDSGSESDDEEGNSNSSGASDNSSHESISEVNASKSMREKKGKQKANQAHCTDDDCDGNHNKQSKRKSKKTIKSRSSRTMTIVESKEGSEPQQEGYSAWPSRVSKSNAYEKRTS